MSDSEETCTNIKLISRLEIKSPCEQCPKKEGCNHNTMSGLAGEFKDPGVRQEHIISVCSLVRKFRPVSYNTVSHHGEDYNIEQRLSEEANIKDPCPTCPSEFKDKCERRRHLDNLAETAQKQGDIVKTLVIVCSQTKREHRLLQISEPKRSV